MAVDWNDLLTIDTEQIAKLLISHPLASSGKLAIRGYSIAFDGTQQRLEKLIERLRRQLLKYVFPESERPEDIDWALARDKFGDIDPSKDGKLGELLLYLFVEAFLKTPLMAYKLKDLGNPNDQVKGADGIFVGEYNNQLAVLIGESKIYADMNSAVKESLESLHRFHLAGAAFSTELMIARKYPSERNLQLETLKLVDELISGSTDRVIVHPVFISYSYQDISKISTSAIDAPRAEDELKKLLVEESKRWKKEIEQLQSKYPKPFQVYLDFFFLPCEDTMNLRNAFYQMLHGHPWESSAVKAALKKEQKEKKKTTKPKGEAPASTGGAEE